MKISVLLIEDDAVDVEVVERAFRECSPDIFDLRHVSRFVDAILEIKRAEPHVIILDLGLPDSSGLDGIERLLMSAPRIPVIVLTGSDDSDLAIKGIELGAQEFLSKSSIKPQSLIRTLRHAIKRKQHQIGIEHGVADERLKNRLSRLGSEIRAMQGEVRERIVELRDTRLDDAQTHLVGEIDLRVEDSIKAANRYAAEDMFIPLKDTDS